MNVIEKIKQSVEAATGLPMYYDTPETLNLRLDSMRLPCAMLFVVKSGAVEDSNGVLRERLTINMLFCDSSDLDFDGLDNERILDGLKRKAFRWIRSLMVSGDFNLVSQNGTGRLYATDDAIVTAFSVGVTIDEIAGVGPCD